jgi:hypothetical protein
MIESLDKIKQELKSDDLEISIPALESVVNNINNLADLSLDLFESNNNRFVITERMSLIFDTYIKKLKSYLDGNSKELQFWAATLIVHYCINNKQAEDVLLNEAKSGSSDEAYVATTILCRTKNGRILNIIRERLETGYFPSDRMRNFFQEKLND